MRVHVESERCIGAGQCVLIAPDFFDQDDDGTVVVLEESVDPDHEGAVRDAANVCPARVIALEYA